MKIQKPTEQHLSFLVQYLREKPTEPVQDFLIKNGASTEEAAIGGAYVSNCAGTLEELMKNFKWALPEEKKEEAPKPDYKVEKKEDGTCNWSMTVNFLKSMEEERLVYGLVYEPDSVDLQGDQASEGEIRKAAHYFLSKSRQVGLNHVESAEGKVSIVESFCTPGEMIFGTQRVKKGSWIMVVKVHDDDLWADVKAQKYTGMSMAGRARSA